MHQRFGNEAKKKSNILILLGKWDGSNDKLLGTPIYLYLIYLLYFLYFIIGWL